MLTLDRACYYLIIALLPLLGLPLDWLWWGGAIALFFSFMGVWRRDGYWLLLAGLIAISYGRVNHFTAKLDVPEATVIQETIVIEQIAKQHEYQSAIAIRANGERLYLYWQSKTPLVLGASYWADLRLRPVSSRLNDGNFHRQRWYIAQRIVATATVWHAQQVATKSEDIRLAWLARLKAHTEGLRSQGILLALAFGERAWLLPEDWLVFQHTATAHLIAISGLHIALAFGIGFWFSKGGLGLLGYLRYRWDGRLITAYPHRFSLFFGFLTACGYSYLAGFSLPTLRAIVAIAFVLACRLARRHYTPWQYWLRVVVVLLVCDPLSLLSESFWLSVLAVACLIFWYRYFPLAGFSRLKAWQANAAWRRGLLALLHLQMGMTLCFLPVQFAFFEGSSSLGLPANLLIVPWYSLLVVPLILVGLLLDPWWSIWGGIDLLIQFSLNILSVWSDHWQTFSFDAQWRWLSGALCLLACLFFRAVWREVGSVIVVGTLGFSQLPTFFQAMIPQPMVEMVHFDVGQGLAVALIYPGKNHKQAILYDTGASWAGGSMAELEILPYLKRHGVTLDALILSHDDNDHAGGASPILAAYPTARLLLSGENRYDSRISEPCIKGQQWQFGPLHLQAIYPMQLAKQANNANSCVLLVQIGQHRLLLTGDSGVAQEREFAAQVGDIDILQVGHHGSKTSTGYTLLAHTQPEIALISAGRFNPWKMPNLSVVSRLLKLGVQPFNTAETGMIRVQFYADHYQIKTARHAYVAWYQRLYGNQSKKSHHEKMADDIGK